MFEKIKSALTFRQGVYTDVKNDASFSRNAWLIIISTSLLSALGSNNPLLRAEHINAWFLGVVGSAIFSVLGFALACYVTTWVGGYFFNTSVKFEEVLRPLGLARVWLGFTFISTLSAIAPALACITGPVGLAAVGFSFFSWLLAIKETLELEWPQSLATLIFGMVVMIGVSIIFNMILTAFGLESASFMDIIH